MFWRTLMACVSPGVADDRSRGGDTSYGAKTTSSPRPSAEPSWQCDGPASGGSRLTMGRQSRNDCLGHARILYQINLVNTRYSRPRGGSECRRLDPPILFRSRSWNVIWQLAYCGVRTRTKDDDENDLGEVPQGPNPGLTTRDFRGTIRER